MTEDIIVSYSELDCYRQCPLKHELSYGKRYTKPSKEGSALQKGSLYHLVMETHYKMIKAHQDIPANFGKVKPAQVDQLLAEIRDVIKGILFNPNTGEPITDVHDLIWWMYEGYVEHYGVDPHWRILGVEHQIITPLPDEDGNPSHYLLKAKMDLLVRDRTAGDSMWVVDHKSGKDLPRQMDLEIDDQFGLYCWAMREVGKKVTGAIHSANRTQRNKSFMPLDTRMDRTYLNRTDVELANLALDAYKVAWNAHPPQGVDLKKYSSPDPRQCGWKCDFKEPHLLMRQGRNPHEVLTEYGFKIDRTRH